MKWEWTFTAQPPEARFGLRLRKDGTSTQSQNRFDLKLGSLAFQDFDYASNAADRRVAGIVLLFFVLVVAEELGLPAHHPREAPLLRRPDLFLEKVPSVILSNSPFSCVGGTKEAKAQHIIVCRVAPC